MLDVLLAAFALPLLALNANACAEPAITAATATPVAHNGNLTTYDVAIVVKNLGSAGEPSSLLQSVEVYQDATKVDQKSAPPLQTGGATTVHYRFSRSSEAQRGSTHLRLHLVMHDPHGATTFCSTAHATYRIDV